MTDRITGVIRGRMIELMENPGFSDGEEIEVILRPLRAMVESTPIGSTGGERRTAAGMLAALSPEVDEELNAIVRDRKKASSARSPNEVLALAHQQTRCNRRDLGGFHSSVAPKGLQQSSPGQRPGEESTVSYLQP